MVLKRVLTNFRTANLLSKLFAHYVYEFETLKQQVIVLSSLANAMKFLYFLRLSAGCELGFTDDADGNSLPFFPPGSAVENFINVPANQNCSFYFGNELHVNYLRCDGTWKSQSLSGVIEVTSGWSISQLSIKVSFITYCMPKCSEAF